MAIIEIVGTDLIDRGRTCAMHANGCGKALVVGDLVRFESVILRFESTPVLPPCPFKKLKIPELVAKLKELGGYEDDNDQLVGTMKILLPSPIRQSLSYA